MVIVKRAKALKLTVADGLEVLDVAFVEILDWDVERHYPLPQARGSAVRTGPSIGFSLALSEVDATVITLPAPPIALTHAGRRTLGATIAPLPMNLL